MHQSVLISHYGTTCFFYNIRKNMETQENGPLGLTELPQVIRNGEIWVFKCLIVVQERAVMHLITQFSLK